MPLVCVHSALPSMLMFMLLQISTCPDCEGAGERATPCNTCGGDGRVRRTKKISLNVPPGVDNGSRLRVRGEGSSGRKGVCYLLLTHCLALLPELLDMHSSAHLCCLFMFRAFLLPCSYFSLSFCLHTHAGSCLLLRCVCMACMQLITFNRTGSCLS